MLDYSDQVYGITSVDEEVLIAVMESTAMQRLKSVLQHGISGLIGITTPTTRFEHSVGAMLLVRRLGGSIREQIAALLHDVSHTAFSHVIDYVFDGHESQSYHDEVKEDFLSKSDIPELLARYGYDWKEFLEEDDFPLLEQPAPALCADRLDYFLRDSLDLGLGTTAKVQEALQHLIVHDGRIVVDDLGVARWLGNTYLAADEASWANFQEVGLYEITAQAIRTGFEVGAIEHDDIWSGDEALWRKLKAAEIPELRERLKIIKPETRFVWDENNPDFHVSTKLRTIDPDVVLDGELKRLSQLDSSFARARSHYLADKQGKWPMRVVQI